MAKLLGVALAKEQEITLISGQSSGIGAEVISGFTEQCINDRQDLNSRLQIFPNPYAADPSLSNNLTLLSDLKKSRVILINAAQIVIVFNGGMGTETETEVAKNTNCKIIPVVQNENDFQNKALKTILNDPIIMEELKKNVPRYFKKLSEGCVSVEDIMLCVKDLL